MQARVALIVTHVRVQDAITIAIGAVARSEKVARVPQAAAPCIRRVEAAQPERVRTVCPATRSSCTSCPVLRVDRTKITSVAPLGGTHQVACVGARWVRRMRRPRWMNAELDFVCDLRGLKDVQLARVVLDSVAMCADLPPLACYGAGSAESTR